MTFSSLDLAFNSALAVLRLISDFIMKNREDRVMTMPQGFIGDGFPGDQASSRRPR
jgi:hypothetical protein